MTPVLDGADLPPGYGTVNPFVAVRGPGGAPAFLRFVADVLGGRETRAAHTVDADDLLIHAEVRVGGSTIMVCDAKPHWVATPALLQVYVRDVDDVVGRAREPAPRWSPSRPRSTAASASRACAIPGATSGGCTSTAPAARRRPRVPTSCPDPSAPPSYVHRTIDEALTAPGAVARRAA